MSGAARCTVPGDGTTATGCAIVYGSVVDAQTSRSIDGVTGSVRFPASCDCLSPVVSVDERGVFSVTVYRRAAAHDTVTATVALFATDPKYPRHHTGGFFFDTARVFLRFAAIGQAPVPVQALLRIPLPAGAF
ncbi:MAG: hypothetical protein ABIZ91_17245 [Gemmatimonadaceae bacterium]